MKAGGPFQSVGRGDAAFYVYDARRADKPVFRMIKRGQPSEKKATELTWKNLCWVANERGDVQRVLVDETGKLRALTDADLKAIYSSAKGGQDKTVTIKGKTYPFFDPRWDAEKGSLRPRAVKRKRKDPSDSDPQGKKAKKVDKDELVKAMLAIAGDDGHTTDVQRKAAALLAEKLME